MESTGTLRRHSGATTLLASLCLWGALTGGSPTRVVAQTVTPTDLIGAWARPGETKVRFTVENDSLITFPIETDQVRGTMDARWRLVGDTLLVDRTRGQAKYRGQQVPVQGSSLERRLVALKDGMLTLTRLDGTQKSQTYVRAAAKPPQP